MLLRRVCALVAGVGIAVAGVGFAPPATAQVRSEYEGNVDPNYVWRSDAASKLLAGKPWTDYVLHRVPGSFHDAPRIPEASNQALTRGNSLYGPSTPIYVKRTNGTESMCTVAVAGHDDKGHKYALTAGHCGEVGDAVTSADSWQVGPSGTIVEVNRDLDYALIELGSNAEVTRSYNGVHINHLGSKPIKPGNVVCKQGVASGRTCGVTLHDWESMNISQTCAMQGDSGAPVVVGDRLVGILNGGVLPSPFDVSCHSPLQGVIHAPTGAVRMDAVLSTLDNGFHLP